MGVKKHNKNVLQKNRVEKFLTKKFKTDFSYQLFYHVFGLFSVRGVQQHDQKNIEK
jgi:hypothetical protein